METLSKTTPGLSIGVTIVLFLTAMAVWVALHRWPGIVRLAENYAARTRFFVRAIVGTTVWWLAIDLASRVLLLDEGWIRPLVAVLGGFTCEMVIELYADQRRMILRRGSVFLPIARVGLVIMLLFVLLEPVLTYQVQMRHERYLAVLLDDSASMQLPDPQSTASEKIQLAKVFGIPLPEGASQAGPLAEPWAALRRQIEAKRMDMLSIVASDRSGAVVELSRHREPLTRLVDQALPLAQAQKKILDELRAHPPTEKVVPAMQTTIDQLARIGDGDLAHTRRMLQTDPRNLVNQLKELHEALQKAINQLQAVETQLRLLPPLLDEAYLTTLPDRVASQVEAIAGVSRASVARQVLLAKPPEEEALLDSLGKRRAVKLYRVAATAQESDVDAWRRAVPESGPVDPLDPTVPQETRQWRQDTDLAAGLARVKQEIPADQLAGILILSDGRHNRGAPAEPLARQLGQQNVPIASIVLGSSQPRKGAAITEIHGPQSVFQGDRVTLSAWIKTWGLKGQSLVVKMLTDEKTVDEKKIAVPADDFRTSVPLVHRPEGVGVHAYTVQLQTPEGDVLQSNKQIIRHVTVTDTRIKLLLVDDRPRWEFRYLRNLFCGRDKTVQLQWLLLNPDRIAGESARPRTAASPARPYGEFEATTLPEKPEDWLKFEVIVLGDLSPSVLNEETLKLLQKFVGQQGGTLVVIAGPNFMPHALANSPLADLLPATFAPSDGPMPVGPESAYRVALSAEGQTHPILRQHANPTESAAVWNRMPILDWRHPVEQVKPGATVLAYADPVDARDLGETGSAPVTVRSDTDRLRLQKQNPLIVTQSYGAGKVLLMCFDRTWRLRYRVGDTHHHQFWGQVFRWATANKLSAGTPHVRLGTERPSYEPGESIVVRAQLLDENSGPVNDAKVEARVLREGRVVLRRWLTSVPNSHGLYQGDLGALTEPGKYRIELSGEKLGGLLAIDQATEAATELYLSPGEPSGELVEYTADRKLPQRLADLSRGRVVGPAEARSLLDVFQAGSKEVLEMKYVALWESWPILVLILIGCCGEWILRKKAGLT